MRIEMVSAIPLVIPLAITAIPVCSALSVGGSNSLFAVRRPPFAVMIAEGEAEIRKKKSLRPSVECSGGLSRYLLYLCIYMYYTHLYIYFKPYPA